MPSKLSLFNDPKRWRERAEEMRALSEYMNDDAVRQTMMSLADDYDRLAQRAEERVREAPKP